MQLHGCISVQQPRGLLPQISCTGAAACCPACLAARRPSRHYYYYYYYYYCKWMTRFIPSTFELFGALWSEN